jgi:hypothetical protein
VTLRWEYRKSIGLAVLLDHPRLLFPKIAEARLAKFGQEWIRTTEGVKPADLQSALHTVEIGCIGQKSAKMRGRSNGQASSEHRIQRILAHV